MSLYTAPSDRNHLNQAKKEEAHESVSVISLLNCNYKRRFDIWCSRKKDK